MANALGEKRTCPACETKFYDLNKNPATCHKCKHSFNPNEEVKLRKSSRKRVEELKEKNELSDLDEKQKRVKKVVRDDELGDIDLSAFDVPELDELGDDGALESIEEDALDGDIESLSELEDREQNDERASLDENEDELTDLDELEEMDTLMDKIVLDEEEEEEEDEDDNK
jgi:hypothetical protein